jgi:5-methylthioadenosine/S-adenosylhomocysteine deaminase
LEHVDLLIRGCQVLTMDGCDRTLQRALVAVNHGCIVHVGSDDAGYTASTEIDGHRKLLMPGLINVHTHIPMTLFRGLAEDIPLNTWLEKVIWPHEAKLKPHDVYAGALLGCTELIKTGTTCFNDMYFYMDQVAEAVAKSGLRAVLAEGMIEQGDPEKGQKALDRSEAFARKYNRFAGGRVRTRLAPHSEYSCSLEFLRKVKDRAKSLGVGIHMHLAESKPYADSVAAELGISATRRLEEIGFLDDQLIVAHCIHVDQEEMDILARHQVGVAHCPVSNMKVALGIAKVVDMVNRGIPVGIGTDGPASNNHVDMLKDMKIAALAQKSLYGDATALPAKKLLRMSTIDGAKALRLDSEIGSVEVGKRADLILIDLNKPHLSPPADPWITVAHSAMGSDVDTVIVEGRILMRSCRLTALNDEEVIEEATGAAKELRSR